MTFKKIVIIFNSWKNSPPPIWVVVTEKSVYEYPNFWEAMHAQRLLGGALMTKEYYTHHYSIIIQK